MASLDGRFSMALRPDARWPLSSMVTFDGCCSMAAVRARWPLLDGRYLMAVRSLDALMAAAIR